MTGRPSRADLAGLWRRGLLRVPGLPDDRATSVTWLQGPARYVDLRQPAGGVPLPGAPSGLEALGMQDLLALARQQASAGTLRLDGDSATRHRAVDLQPPAPAPGPVRFRLHPRSLGELPGSTDLLVEDALLERRVEEWWRVSSASARRAARSANAVCATLEESDSGRRVLLVRVGRWFGLARDRGVPLPPLRPGLDLAAAVLGVATLSAARALLDCEVSQGVVDDDGWTVQRSTLPWRVGRRLAPRLAGDTLLPSGTPAPRWWIRGLDGDPGALEHRPQLYARETTS